MLPALFAETAVGWTNTEVTRFVLTAVGGTLAVVVPIAWGLVKMLTRSAERRAAKLEGANRILTKRVEELDAGDELEKGHREIEHLTAELDQVRAQADGFQAALVGVQGERDEIRRERDEAREERDAESRRIRKAVQRDGVVWTERVLANAPEFKALHPDIRRTPVISMLNLKGGVGKTTATAHLGTALARRGWRVLLVDLNLQGSLTSLFIDDAAQKQRSQMGRLTGNFLESSFDSEVANLPDDFAVPVLPGAVCDLIPTTDEMAYAETNLTVRWFLKDARRDPRFLLRKELQLKRVTNEYDIVLLDCPPLINISCVNALAASDFVLVPVMPSRQATDRVTILMERLRAFRDNLNTSLRVMGFFANRTKESDLTADERSRLADLKNRCRDTWAAAPCFDAFIRQSIEVRQAEDDRRPLVPGDDLYPAFDRLAAEVEDRLPMFCRPTTKAAAPTGATV